MGNRELECKNSEADPSGFSTAGVAAEEQEQAVDRVGDAVGDDWSSQATSSPKEQEPQESAIDHVFDHSRNALADVGTAEKYVDEDRANGPSNTRITPNSGKAIHQVAAVDHLFTERSKGPGERESKEQELDVVAERLERRKVRHFADAPPQARRRSKQFE